MPDDERRVVLVPVDPEAYGLGLGLGCLLKYWKEVLIAVILMPIVVGVIVQIGEIGQRVEQAKYHRQTAETEPARSATAVVNTSLAAQALPRLSEAMQQGQSIQVNSQKYLQGGELVLIKTVDFAADGLRVYFDYQARNYLSPKVGSLVWEGSNCAQCRQNFYIVDPTLVTNVKSAQPSAIRYVQEGPVLTDAKGEAYYHYMGYWVFPYEVFPSEAAQMGPDTLTYFINFGEDPSYYNLQQVPVLDLASWQNWAVVQHLESYASAAQARELSEGANSYMHMHDIEHEMGDAGLMLSFDAILDQDTHGFYLVAPEEVFVEAGGQKFPATAWGGLFQGDERIGELGSGSWGGGSINPLGSIYFANAWSAVQQAGCFNLVYGASYRFENVCLDGQGSSQATIVTPTPTYMIVSRQTGECIDVPDGVRQDAELITWSCHGDANQRWSATTVADGVYTFVSQVSGLCMDVYYWGQEDGTRIWQAGCHGGENQQWLLLDAGNGYYQIQARHSGMCLTLDPVPGEDSRLAQRACQATDDQLWMLQP